MCLSMSKRRAYLSFGFIILYINIEMNLINLMNYLDYTINDHIEYTINYLSALQR